jgi:hypothetical protein
MKYLFFCFALLSSWSCQRDLEPAGPLLTDLYGNFRVIEPLALSTGTVDFSTGQQAYFSARMSILVDWQLKITGRSSGAVKRITGRSRVLDISNASWFGETTDFPTFQAEVCDVQLTFVGQPDTLRSEITVTGRRVLDATVLDDFETGLSPLWTTFVQSGADMKFVGLNTPPLAEGVQYYRMGGTVGWDWLKGLLGLRASAYNATTGFGLSSDAASVYFNGIFRQKSGLSNGIVLLQFREDDNGDGAHAEGTEDMWSIEIRPGVDWKLESVKYVDLATLVNGQPAGPLGNGVHEPQKLFRVDVLFLANPTSGYAECDMDLLAFSRNEPLKP